MYLARIDTFLQAFALCCLLLPVYTDTKTDGQDGTVVQQDAKRYKFLYFAFEKLGSHGMYISQSGKVLARQGHSVTFLLGSDGPRMPKTSDADVFSFAVFKSEYTAEARREEFRRVSRVSLSGGLASFWGLAALTYRGIVSGKPLVMNMLLEECDALLADKKTIEELRRAKFDMLVADDYSRCGPILAEALDIPFVECANWGASPGEYGLL